MNKFIFLTVLLGLVCVSCAGGNGTPTAPPQPGDTPLPPATSTVPSPDPTLPPEPVATATPVPPLPPEPQEIAFQASDGQALTGLYYPAAVNPAPVVVFMHWVVGSQEDWYEIAVWLQNRGQANPFPVLADFPRGDPNRWDPKWWDPSWFPPVPADRSYAVFIFSFRGCTPRGCDDWRPDEWLLDAQAAVMTASELEGVDPARIVTVGSSIGADAAPNACLWLNAQKPGACRGAFSLSPGGYVGEDYPDVVQALGQAQPPIPAWCLADETEIAICNAAADAGHPAYRAVTVPGGGHGQFLISPDLNPLPMQLLLDFLSETVGP